MDDRCIHDMLPGQCADCTGRDGGERAEAERRQRLLARPHVYEAAYPGRCANCGTPFGVGEPIENAAERGGRANLDPRWVASCCIEGT